MRRIWRIDLYEMAPGESQGKFKCKIQGEEGEVESTMDDARAAYRWAEQQLIIKPGFVNAIDYATERVERAVANYTPQQLVDALQEVDQLPADEQEQVNEQVKSYIQHHRV